MDPHTKLLCPWHRPVSVLEHEKSMHVPLKLQQIWLYVHWLDYRALHARAGMLGIDRS